MTCFRFCWVIIFSLSFSAALGWAQNSPLPDASYSTQNAEQQPDQDLQHKLLILRQKKQYEEMQRDSQKLLELATELKQYVDKSGENILSIEVIRKAEAMEKLARQIRTDMRGD